ncbi:MAG: SEC-C metal-binding domain-containing protein [Planctomycetota bacterium]|nr:SEC-C metal-binding domain-containing protein [Planctomycetota bacterium]
MDSTVRVGRNELCPCGSGKKYKNCCERREAVVTGTKGTPSRSIGIVVGVVVVGLALAGAVALRVLGEEEPATNTRTANTTVPAVLPPAPFQPLATGTLTPPPPGPTPAGKVWSPEHGHYHDAPNAASPNAPTPFEVGADGSASLSSTPAALTPQPPGPVPEGKVWSPEHGHWHDALPGAVTPR